MSKRLTLADANIYYFKIDTKNCDTNRYPLLKSDEIKVSGKEIKEAIITCGILPRDPSLTSKYQRSDEIKFKQYLIKTAIDVDVDTDMNKEYLHYNFDNLQHLDSSEKGAINYYMGMFFARLISKKVFGVEILVHLRRYRMLGNKVGLLGKEEPDFIGMDANERVFSAFEAKGREKIGAGIKAKAKNQLNSISSINGISPDPKISIITHPSKGTKYVECYIEDPFEEGTTKIELNKDRLIYEYYLPVVELLDEIDDFSNNHSIDASKKDEDDNIVREARINGEKYEVSMPKKKYDWVKRFKLTENATSREKIKIEEIE